MSVLGLNDASYLMPYCNVGTPWNARYSIGKDFEGKEHYWIWSLDCSKTYNSTTTSDLKEYKGDFYSSKIFIDGKLLYDTYYSKQYFDYLKNNQSNLNLKYFTIGRCSMIGGGYWHYSKMKTYCMRLYNRGLSNEEMLENYNATKAYYSTIIEN